MLGGGDIPNALDIIEISCKYKWDAEYASHYFYTEIPEEVSTEIKEFIRTLEEDER